MENKTEKKIQCPSNRENKSSISSIGGNIPPTPKPPGGNKKK